MRGVPELTDERLLLDLLNSTPVVEGGQDDLLSAAWAREHGGSGSAAEVAGLREARDLLQAVVRGEEAATALEPLLRDVRLRPEARDDGLLWRPELPDDRRAAVSALLTWSDVTERLPGRLRACANDDCRLFLLDRSHANQARWCSMKSCGNRMKARRHYRRGRAAAGADETGGA